MEPSPGQRLFGRIVTTGGALVVGLGAACTLTFDLSMLYQVADDTGDYSRSWSYAFLSASILFGGVPIAAGLLAAWIGLRLSRGTWRLRWRDFFKAMRVPLLAAFALTFVLLGSVFAYMLIRNSSVQ